MAKKAYEESNIAAIADAIREKTGTETTYTTAEMAGGIGEVYDAGKQAQYDAFWDSYLQNGTITEGGSIFAGRGWNDAVFKPKYIIKPTWAERMFYKTGIKNLATDKLDFSQTTNTAWMLAEALTEHIGEIDLSNVTTANGAFYYVAKLHTIDKIILNANGATQSGGSLIQLCPILQNVTIEGMIAESMDFKGCTSLSRESIESIVNALSDSTSGLTLTIPNAAIVNAFGGENEEEWIALMNTKTNWTIVW